MPVGLDESEEDGEFDECTNSKIHSTHDASDSRCDQCDVLFNVLLVYHNELTDTQKASIKSKVPNIEHIVDTLCSESLPSHASGI
jgi:hypothetical protein